MNQGPEGKVDSQPPQLDYAVASRPLRSPLVNYAIGSILGSIVIVTAVIFSMAHSEGNAGGAIAFFVLLGALTLLNAVGILIVAAVAWLKNAILRRRMVRETRIRGIVVGAFVPWSVVGLQNILAIIERHFPSTTAHVAWTREAVVLLIPLLLAGWFLENKSASK